MNRLRAFLEGRYGMDQLNIAIIIISCVITFITSFLRIRYYRLFVLIPYVFVILRFLSRNIPARQRENEHFMHFWQPIKKYFAVKFMHYSDKAHKYYKCPKCKHVLRVPSNRGKIVIDCPYCKQKFKRNTGKAK